MRQNICKFLTIAILASACTHAGAQTEPATEPSVVAVGKVWPAVVNINTEGTIRRTVSDPFDSFYNQFFGGPMRPPREMRQKVKSLGSGFIVDPDGYIVTNQHVVERAADLKIQVTTTDGKTYDAKYIAGDPKSDLAFIKIEGKTPFPHISLTDISPNLLGETVLALGNPLGYGVSVSRGMSVSVKSSSACVGSKAPSGAMRGRISASAPLASTNSRASAAAARWVGT